MKNTKMLSFISFLFIVIIFSSYFFSKSQVPDFQSYAGLLFYDLEEQEFFLEDIESGSDILLEFKYEDASNFELNSLQHVQIHGFFNKANNSLRVISLHETGNDIARNS